ncbi:hypothetical protein QAD02_013222 [Eretmocerus hayati]|uniref:Uncharacterized protein n=1 Tax=Eretmocerus hayati TaxID=131215 RepID=A0ACC2P211_9HYME|nr:hypothetical protein QAD02_013222 [Eretmocerus hayati]
MDQINAAGRALPEFLPTKKIIELEKTKRYKITKIRKVKTSWGPKVILELENEFEVFVPSELNDLLIADTQGSQDRRCVRFEIRIHVSFLEERIFLTKTSDVDENTIDSWKDQCTRSIDTLKRVLHNPSLTVPQKQSVTHAIGKIMSSKLTLGSTVKQGSGLSNNNGPRIQWTDPESAFKKRMRTSFMTNLHHIDLKKSLKDASELFAKKIGETMRENQNAFKINSVLSRRFTQTVNNDEDSREVIDIKDFNTKNAEVLPSTRLKQWFIDHIQDPLLKEIEDFQEKDSGWSFSSMMNLQININRSKLMRSGGAYIPLPQFTHTKHSCINIMNNDDQCFKWAILAALHPVPRNNHPNWINHYIQ